MNVSFLISFTNLLASNSEGSNMAAIIVHLISLALLLVNNNNLGVCEDQEVWRSTDMAKNACDQEAEYQETGKFPEPKKDDQGSKHCGWFSKGIPRGDACSDIRMHFQSCKDLIIGSEGSARVVNGTKPREYVFKSIAKYGTCTGSIIQKNFVLTAGHCTIPTSSNKPRNVQLASYEGESPHRQEIMIRNKITHENYSNANGHSFFDDVGLVKIGSAIFNEYVQPATLPPSRDFVAMGPAYFIGYGLLGTGNYDSALREITLPIIPTEKCKKFFKNLPDDAVCAGYDHKRMGLCNGDSGGPLFVCKNYRLVQIGVLSGSTHDPGNRRCADYPGVFTRVTSYLDWISSTIEKNTDPPPPTNPPSNKTIR